MLHWTGKLHRITRSMIAYKAVTVVDADRTKFIDRDHEYDVDDDEVNFIQAVRSPFCDFAKPFIVQPKKLTYEIGKETKKLSSIVLSRKNISSPLPVIKVRIPVGAQVRMAADDMMTSTIIIPLEEVTQRRSNRELNVRFVELMGPH